MTDSQHSQISSSSVSSCEVKTPRDESVGSIKELMFNMSTGEIDYVVLKVNEGFLNLGSKLLALPFESFEFNTAQEDVVIVKESKETLENAPGFNSDNWPSGPQAEFLHSMRSYYSEKTRSLNGRYDHMNRSFFNEGDTFDTNRNNSNSDRNTFDTNNSTSDRNTFDSDRNRFESDGNSFGSDRTTSDSDRNIFGLDRNISDSNRNTFDLDSDRPTRDSDRTNSDTNRNTFDLDSDRNSADSDQNIFGSDRNTTDSDRNIFGTDRNTSDTNRNSFDSDGNTFDSGRNTSESDRSLFDLDSERQTSDSDRNTFDSESDRTRYDSDRNTNQDRRSGEGSFDQDDRNDSESDLRRDGKPLL